MATKKKTTKYCIVDNDSGDSYVIPADKRNHWYNEWMYSEEYENGDNPEYATYVPAGRLVFEKWSIED